MLLLSGGLSSPEHLLLPVLACGTFDLQERRSQMSASIWLSFMTWF